MLLISGIYGTVITILLVVIIKNGFKMKHDAHSQEARQYFYTALIILGIILLSFLAILLRAAPEVFATDGGGSTVLGVSAGEKNYTLLKWIIAIILIILMIGLFDWFVLRRTSKTVQQYKRRRLFVFGIAALAAVFLLKSAF